MPRASDLHRSLGPPLHHERAPVGLLFV